MSVDHLERQLAVDLQDEVDRIVGVLRSTSQASDLYLSRRSLVRWDDVMQQALARSVDTDNVWFLEALLPTQDRDGCNDVQVCAWVGRHPQPNKATFRVSFRKTIPST